MALTAAEKMRRYRERIKNDPQKHEQQRKKDVERMKIKRKKISELSDQQKEKQREQWKAQKRQQREKKTERANKVETTKKEATTTLKYNEVTQINKVKYLKKKCGQLHNESKKYEDRMKKLVIVCEKLKKRHYRLKKDHEKKMKEKDKKISELIEKEEILKDTIKKTYKECEKRYQKRIIKRLVTNSKSKTYISKLIGLTGRVKKSYDKSCDEVKEIAKFYLRDDVSRCTAGKRECRTKNKDKKQIRYLLDTLVNLYQKYINEGGKYKFTTFFKYKPFYVLTPHLGSRNTCICIKHDNIELKFATLKKYSVLEQNNLKAALATQTCDLKSYKCMYGKCTKCKNIPVKNNPARELTENVTWSQWERTDHEYSKKEGSEFKVIKTKKTVKALKTGKIQNLIQEFDTDVKKFKKHYFNVYHQQEKYQYIVNHLKENEVVIICDFSENYETKLNKEIQSMHFGASKSQITLHTGMVYFREKSQSFCTLSSNNMHQPPAIWAHLLPVIKMIKKDVPKPDVIHFYSDGPSSQYRQKHNFYLLDLFTEKLKLKYTTWSFFESGHGKGVADGIGGSVKRALDRQVCFGKDIRDASDAYNILDECMKSVKIWYVTENDINNIASILPQNIRTLIGTMQIHQIFTKGNGTISYRDVSCFCGDLKGLCRCFEPKLQYVRSNIKFTPSSVIEDVTLSVEPTTPDLPLIQDTNINSDSFKESPIDEETKSKNTPNILSLPINLDALKSISVKENIILESPATSLSLPMDKEASPQYSTTNLALPLDHDYGFAIQENVIIKDSFMDISINTSNEMQYSLDLPDLFSDDFFDVHNCVDIQSHSDLTEINTVEIQALRQPDQSDIENYPTIANSIAAQSTKQNNIIDLTLDDKINNKKKSLKSSGFKSLRTYVSRQFSCEKCKKVLTLNGKAKCMCCKKFFCLICSRHQQYIDYICDSCLNADSD